MGDYFLKLFPANRDATKFKTTYPANQVVKLSSVIALPAFSYTGLIWKGASQLLAQFNLSLANNFTIPALPSGAGRNFCLCIRHRIGTTPYRYKLWSGVGEILYTPQQYVSEVIKKNFTLEIWSTPTSTASLASPLSIATSILVVPTTIPAVGPVIAGTAVERIPQQFGTINPAANPNVLDYLQDNV